MKVGKGHSADLRLLQSVSTYGVSTIHHRNKAGSHPFPQPIKGRKQSTDRDSSPARWRWGYPP